MAVVFYHKQIKKASLWNKCFYGTYSLLYNAMLLPYSKYIAETRALLCNQPGSWTNGKFPQWVKNDDFPIQNSIDHKWVKKGDFPIQNSIDQKWLSCDQKSGTWLDAFVESTFSGKKSSWERGAWNTYDTPKIFRIKNVRIYFLVSSLQFGGELITERHFSRKNS